MPFYITVGFLGAFAIGTVVYFWYQLRPPPPLVNVNPPRPANEVATAAQPPAPTSGTTAQAAPATTAPIIPGLPPSVANTTAAAAPTAQPVSPGIPQAVAPNVSAPGTAIAPVPSPSQASRGSVDPLPRAATTPINPVAPAAAVPPASVAPRSTAERGAATRGPQTAQPLAPTARTVSRPGAAGGARNVSVTRPEPSVDPRIETAYAEFQAGKLDAARTGYTRVLREDPGHRDALLGLAAIETREQRSEVAEALYQRLLQADPRDAHAQAGLLSLRAGQIDPVAAESRLKSLLSSDPDSGVLHAALGNQYALQGRWPEAQQAYFRAYSAEPDNPDLAYNLAVSLDHLRQAALAAEYYRRAIALGAKRPFSFDTASARQRAEALAR